MNRNSENHFAITPTVSIPRSTFYMPKNIKTTFNTGKLIPFYLNQDILPGDTMQVDANYVVRMSTPIVPTMDNLIFDTYFFYVPNRITWQHWKEFMGENTKGAWAQTVQYSVPQILFYQVSANSPHSILKGDIADYFGLPLFDGTQANKKISVSRLPFTGYCQIWNEYFRNQNLEAPIDVYLGDADARLLSDSNTARTDWHDSGYTTANVTRLMPGTPAPTNKTADYFTTCNPAPEKAAAPVTLPIGSSAPVYGNGNSLMLTDGTNVNALGNRTTNDIWLAPSDKTANVAVGTSATVPAGLSDGVTIGVVSSGDSGLYTDLSNAVAATINAQRLAFATQRILERDTFGTRYREVLKNHFHVINGDARQQIPEYLGGKRIFLSINQTIQSSETASTPLGTTGAFSHTVDSDRVFTKSFVEHGMVIGLCTTRIYRHSYCQGIERGWSRKERLDFYWPELCHLGEQAVLNKEIYADGTSNDDEVFGYQERWAEYKYSNDIATGAMRPTYAQPLSQWSYTDHYQNLPVLSGEWSNEDMALVDRTLAVTSQVEDQFIMDCWLKINLSRAMATYSLPGLIDHY